MLSHFVATAHSFAHSLNPLPWYWQKFAHDDFDWWKTFYNSL